MMKEFYAILQICKITVKRDGRCEVYDDFGSCFIFFVFFLIQKGENMRKFFVIVKVLIEINLVVVSGLVCSVLYHAGFM